MPTPTLTKWHGGKGYLAGRFWDIALAGDWRPIHVVEPYCGGAAFTLEGLVRDLPFSFVINDSNHELTNFWRVMQDQATFDLFRRRVEATPFSEWEWKRANRRLLLEEIDVQHAASFFIANRQSLAGRMKSFTGITRTRTRRNMNNEVSAWLTVVDGLPEFHLLLRKVLILDARPAVEVIRSQDGEKTLVYADPPYCHSTRATTEEYGQQEMTDAEHAELLCVLAGIKGRFMLSGYHCPLYDDASKKHGWTCHEFNLPNNAAGGTEKRRMVKCLWCNFQ